MGLHRRGPRATSGSSGSSAAARDVIIEARLLNAGTSQDIELSAFYLFPPGVKSAFGRLFATHPQMEKRIAALERLERQLQGVA